MGCDPRFEEHGSTKSKDAIVLSPRLLRVSQESKHGADRDVINRHWEEARQGQGPDSSSLRTAVFPDGKRKMHRTYPCL